MRKPKNWNYGRRALALLIVIWTGSVAADLEQCSPETFGNFETARAVEFLASLRGTYQVGRCLIELTVCQRAKSTGNDSVNQSSNDTVIGDLLVTDQYGKKFYLVLDLNPVRTPLNSVFVQNGSRMLHYESLDRVFDPQNGRYENFRLEILKPARGGDVIESLDLGIYTSKLREGYTNLKPGHGYWINCSR